MHPRSKHWHLTHYVIVQRTDRKTVRVTKAMYGADYWSDHSLVVSKLDLRIEPSRRPQGKKALKRQDVSKLNQDNMRQVFTNDICNNIKTIFKCFLLDAMSLSSEDKVENWAVFLFKMWFILQL